MLIIPVAPLRGFGCLSWQPLALRYGKRPIYLISILANVVISSVPLRLPHLLTVQGIPMWARYTTMNGLWIATKILQGFFAAPIESRCEISVTDIYFTHERGTYIALCGFLLRGA